MQLHLHQRLWSFLRADLSRMVRFVLLYGGFVLPLICHGWTLSGSPDAADWQSGAIHDKVSFVLSSKGGWVLYPFMLYPMTCLILLLRREGRFAASFAVRFGILTGVPVSIWYCAILGMLETNMVHLVSPKWFFILLIGGASILAPILVYFALRGLLWIRQKLKIRWRVVLLLSILVYPVSLIVCTAAGQELNEVVLWPFYASMLFLITSLFFGPFWCLGAYLFMSARLAILYPASRRFRLIQLMAGVTWLAGFLTGCRRSVELSLEEYAKLPLENPGCYIATAATCGHASFVRSWPIALCDGSMTRFNRQLAVLKAGELAMRAIAPTAHYVVRKIYDSVGPPAAACLQTPLRADIAFALLKPFEWTTWLALHALLGKKARLVDRFYRENVS